MKPGTPELTLSGTRWTRGSWSNIRTIARYFSVMDEWQTTYAAVVSALNAASGLPVFFRGHRDVAWTLSPTLARCTEMAREHTGIADVPGLEQTLYSGFTAKAGDLLASPTDSWSHLFAMQHHGVPTRLLDWTECFAVALYFALKDSQSDAAIWLLDPYALNSAALGSEGIIDPSRLGSYDDLYMTRRKDMPEEADVVALYPVRRHRRVFNQHSGFTLHNDLDHPLEELYPSCVTKIVIPRAAQEKARTFLYLAGVSEFSLFGDLDGLARDLTKTYIGPHRSA